MATSKPAVRRHSAWLKQFVVPGLIWALALIGACLSALFTVRF